MKVEIDSRWIRIGTYCDPATLPISDSEVWAEFASLSQSVYVNAVFEDSGAVFLPANQVPYEDLLEAYEESLRAATYEVQHFEPPPPWTPWEGLTG